MIWGMMFFSTSSMIFRPATGVLQEIPHVVAGTRAAPGRSQTQGLSHALHGGGSAQEGARAHGGGQPVSL